MKYIKKILFITLAFIGGFMLLISLFLLIARYFTVQYNKSIEYRDKERILFFKKEFSKFDDIKNIILKTGNVKINNNTRIDFIDKSYSGGSFINNQELENFFKINYMSIYRHTLGIFVRIDNPKDPHYYYVYKFNNYPIHTGQSVYGDWVKAVLDDHRFILHVTRNCWTDYPGGPCIPGGYGEYDPNGS